MAPSRPTLPTVAASAVAVTAVLAFAAAATPTAATPITDNGAVAAASRSVAAPGAAKPVDWQAAGAVGDDAPIDWEPAVVGDALAVAEPADGGAAAAAAAVVDAVADTADDVDAAVRDKEEMEVAVIQGGGTGDEPPKETTDPRDGAAKDAEQGNVVDVRPMDKDVKADVKTQAEAEMAKDVADANATGPAAAVPPV